MYELEESVSLSDDTFERVNMFLGDSKTLAKIERQIHKGLSADDPRNGIYLEEGTLSGSSLDTHYLSISAPEEYPGGFTKEEFQPILKNVPELEPASENHDFLLENGYEPTNGEFPGNLFVLKLSTPVLVEVEMNLGHTLTLAEEGSIAHRAEYERLVSGQLERRLRSLGIECLYSVGVVHHDVYEDGAGTLRADGARDVTNVDSIPVHEILVEYDPALEDPDTGGGGAGGIVAAFKEMKEVRRATPKNPWIQKLGFKAPNHLLSGSDQVFVLNTKHKDFLAAGPLEVDSYYPSHYLIKVHERSSW